MLSKKFVNAGSEKILRHSGKSHSKAENRDPSQIHNRKSARDLAGSKTSHMNTSVNMLGTQKISPRNDQKG